MKTTEKHAAFLLTLLIPILFTGCKSNPIEILPSATETPDASNNFVGVWERIDRRDHNLRHIYIFTDKNNWESYAVYQGIVSPYPYKTGTYTYRGSHLFMTYIVYWGNYGHASASSYDTIIAVIDGDELKIKNWTGENPIHRVSEDFSDMK